MKPTPPSLIINGQPVCRIKPDWLGMMLWTLGNLCLVLILWKGMKPT